MDYRAINPVFKIKRMTQKEFDSLPDATMLAVVGKTINGNCKFFLKGEWYTKIDNKIEKWKQ